MSQLMEAELPAVPDLSADQQRENCEHIVETAGNIARLLRTKIEEQVAGSYPAFAEQAHSIFESIEKGVPVNGYQCLKEPGTWLPEVVWAAIQGRRTVVSLPWFGMLTNRDKDGVDRVVDHPNTLTSSLGRIIRAIRPPHNEMQTNYPVYDDCDPATGKHFNEQARLRFQADVDRFLRAEGAVLPEDKQGKDYNLLSLGRNRHLFTRKLLPYLENSPWGKVERGAWGAVDFYPHDELLDIVPMTMDAKMREWYSKNGLCLRYSDGMLSSAALTATATAWQAENRTATRLNILDRNERETNEQFMVFRALELTNRERFHTVQVPSNYPEPLRNIPPYALVHQIKNSADRFMASFTYDDFELFDSVEYAMRNYGEMLTDDKNLCMLTMFALNFLSIKDARAVDIGCGPNLYPAMLLEPYSRTIDLLEFAAGNRAFLEQWFNDALPSNQQHMFNKFALLMLGGGGSQYHNVIPRLKQGYQDGRLRVAFGDSFDLPEGEWDLITNSFVGDSITWQKLLFPITVRKMMRALKPEGVLFSAYVLNDPDHTGYPAGQGRKFPNISQSVEEIRNVYIDSGMECIVLPTAGPEKFREGYSGLAFVVAAPRGSQRALKIKEMARPIHEFAASGFGRAT